MPPVFLMKDNKVWDPKKLNFATNIEFTRSPSNYDTLILELTGDG